MIPSISLDGPKEAKKRIKKPLGLTFVKSRYNLSVTPCKILDGPREDKKRIKKQFRTTFAKVR